MKRVYAMRNASLNADDVVHRRCVVERDARAPRSCSYFSDSAKTSIRQWLLAIQNAGAKCYAQKLLRARVLAFPFASRQMAISARLKKFSTNDCTNGVHGPESNKNERISRQ